MKYICIAYFLFFTVIKSSASPNDTILTRYTNGVFKTFSQLSLSSDDRITNEVVNLFVNQMCYDIEGLFKWGLKGMGLANEKDELVYFDFKETKFNKQTAILKGIGDVHVTGISTFKDVSVDTKLTQRNFNNTKREVRLDLASPNLFIRNLSGSFYFIPKRNNKQSYLQLVVNVRFAWFFDIFVTQKTYKTILEWRIRQVLKNIKEASEKRTKLMYQKS